MIRIIYAVVLLVVIASCSTTNEYQHEDGLADLSLTDFQTYLKIIASDEFQGRKPFTVGEQKTIAYLEQQFKEIGLEPGNGDSYFQEVPMVDINAHPDSVMTIEGAKEQFTLRGFHDYTLNTQRTDSLINWKDEELVFAGFGAVAPEYNWNDYDGLDVKNKIVIVLVNDPGFGGDDTTFFKGNTMTYYGRWTYKYEEAARQGAKGCFVVHNTIPAGYPFGVLQNTWNNSQLYLDPRGKNEYVCEGVGWLSKSAAEKIFSSAGLDFNAQQSLARQRGFKGQSLNLKVTTRMKPTVKFDKTMNVVGVLKGHERADEFIIYTAHWDHLGIGKKDATGDSIFNGAMDNASGTAGLLTLAKAFTNLKKKPQRSLVFLAVTAEEQGLWGSAYYAENPIFPVKNTVANINMDGINPYGKMKDVMIVGKGQNSLEEILKEEARLLGREVTFDSEPEKGSYFRSDHFNFARIGIPALYLKTGDDFEGKGKEYGHQLKSNYTQKIYHQPSDEFKNFKFDGAIEDLKLLFQVGKRLAFSNDWPTWNVGSEFKAAREMTKSQQ